MRTAKSFGNNNFTNNKEDSQVQKTNLNYDDEICNQSNHVMYYFAFSVIQMYWREGKTMRTLIWVHFTKTLP